jgi:pimeloyl-ACP methyl ester carboxylesterase
MPFAGTGYAVIAPDYAGLGNGGAQGYLDNEDTGHSALDAARALRKLVPGAFSTKIIFIGHSQGGGASLSAQALASSYGADGEVIGIIVFAAEWQTRLNSFAYIDALNSPSELTILDGVADPPIYVMRQYAYQINDVGDLSGGDGFPAAKASELVDDVQTECLTALGGVVQADGPYLRDLVDPTLSAGVLACVNGAGADAGCTGTGLAFYDYLSNNILTGDPNGAPVVYIQGLADIIMPPAQEAACNIAKLEADGVPIQLCVDAAATHTNVVQRNAAYALSWVSATLAGTAVPSCTEAGLPACAP